MIVTWIFKVNAFLQEIGLRSDYNQKDRLDEESHIEFG